VVSRDCEELSAKVSHFSDMNPTMDYAPSNVSGSPDVAGRLRHLRNLWIMATTFSMWRSESTLTKSVE